MGRAWPGADMRRSGTTSVLALAVALAAGCSGGSAAPSAATSSTASATGAASSSGTSSPAPTPGAGAAGGASTGVSRPTGPARAGDQSQVLTSLPGSPRPGCVVVGDRADVRSGTMAAGNFVRAREEFRRLAASQPQPSIFLYVIPGDARRPRSVTVQLRQLSGGTARRTVTSSSVQDADQWKYFAVNVFVPGPGTWRLTTRAGADRGCFDVTFG
jgi:hypothetical protein